MSRIPVNPDDIPPSCRLRLPPILRAHVGDVEAGLHNLILHWDNAAAPVERLLSPHGGRRARLPQVRVSLSPAARRMIGALMTRRDISANEVVLRALALISTNRASRSFCKPCLDRGAAMIRNGLVAPAPGRAADEMHLPIEICMAAGLQCAPSSATADAQPGEGLGEEMFQSQAVNA